MQCTAIFRWIAQRARGRGSGSRSGTTLSCDVSSLCADAGCRVLVMEILYHAHFDFHLQLEWILGTLSTLFTV